MTVPPLTTDAALKAAVRALSPSLTIKKTECDEYRVTVAPSFFENKGMPYPEARERSEAIANYVDARGYNKREQQEMREEAYAAAKMIAQNVIWLR